MSCFCIDILPGLPSLSVSADVGLSFSARGQTAAALTAWIGLGLPSFAARGRDCREPGRGAWAEIAAAPCAFFHARSIMAGIAAGPQVALQGAAGPVAMPGSVTSAFQAVSDRADAAVASLEEAASAVLETSLQAAANVSFSADAPTPAAGAGAAAGVGMATGVVEAEATVEEVAVYRPRS